MTTVWLLATGVVASANDDARAAALDGYCPVAYKYGHAVKGKPEFSSQYEGKTYFFPERQAKQMFDANPKAYRFADQRAKATFDQDRDAWIAKAGANWPKLAPHSGHRHGSPMPN